MIYVTWHDATAYAKWRVRGYLVKQSGEYAARGGLVGKRYPWGDSMLTSQANYGGNVGNPVSVGSYSANDYGLYDMSGNIWEWCADWYDENYYSISSVNNPQGPGTGERRVLRGGSWDFITSGLRVAYRNSFNPTVRNLNNGFRCVSGF